MLKIIAVIALCGALVGCGAGINPGCKKATESGYCKYSAP